MKNVLRFKYMKIHLLFLFVALLLTVLTYFIVFFQADLYSSEQQYVFRTLETHYSIYHDIDNNGHNNRIVFGSDEESGVHFVVPFNDNNTIREQFNFFNKRIESNKYTFDLNNDDYDEIIVFTRSDSTLFLSIVDVKLKEFILLEKPIMHRPKEVTTEFWDLKSVIVYFHDIDKDNNYEMYLSPRTAHAIYPRGIYVYDTESFELINKFPTTAPVNKIVFFDFNDDGNEEILVHAASSGNTRDNKGIHDQFNWFLMFDKNLNLIREPKKIGPFLTGYNFYVVRKNMQPYLLVIFCNHKNEYPKDSFSLYNFDLELVEQKTFDANAIGNSYKDPNILVDYFFVSTSTGTIQKYNLDFELLACQKLGKNGYKFSMEAELCEAEGKEIIVLSGLTMDILSSDLSIIAHKEFDSVIETISLDQSADQEQPNIVIDTKDGVHSFVIITNFLSRYSAILLFGVLVIYFLLLIFLHHLISRISRIIGAYNYSYDDVDIGIIIIDYLGRVKSYNKSIFYNLPPDMSLQKNRNIFRVFNKSHEIKKILAYAIKGEKEIKRKLSFTKENYRFIGQIHILPLFTLFKVPHAFVIKIQNLTKQIESDRNLLWSKISQKIAHDIKTPLSTIQLNLSALKSRIEKGSIDQKADINDDLDMIQNEIKEITELTRSFLKFSSLEKPNLQWVAIDKILSDSTRPFKKYFENGIQFELDIKDEVDSIWADGNQMTQLLHILLENSIDAIKSEGKIKFSLDLVEDLQHSDRQYVEISISDNGQGITKEEVDKVFEPYFTQKKDGTGMGLSIAKKIVEDHGGSIHLSSKINFGTTITIKLPHNKN